MYFIIKEKENDGIAIGEYDVVIVYYRLSAVYLGKYLKLTWNGKGYERSPLGLENAVWLG